MTSEQPAQNDRAGKRLDVTAEGPAVPAGHEDVPYTLAESALVRMRKVIARNMMNSVQSAAHATLEVAVDASSLAISRTAVNADRDQHEKKISYLPFIAAATAATLQACPRFNATYDGDRYILWETVNLGIAVDTPRGLIVPVIREAEQRSVLELEDEIRALAGKARERTLAMADLLAGTFTISNLGSHGVQRATAIINHPQVAILSVPSITMIPVPRDDGAFAFRPTLNLSVTYDHRAVDGADAARFLNELRDRLESSPPPRYPDHG